MVLIRSELLGQFVNTLTADYKYSRYNREYLWQQVPRPISEEPKTFSGLFITFVKYKLNLQYFEKKDQSRILSFKELINCETGRYLNVQKSMFHATLWQITC